jgi:hypothetical protein
MASVPSTPIKPLPKFVQKIAASVWPEIESRLDIVVTTLLTKVKTIVDETTKKAGDAYMNLKIQIRMYLGMK